MMLKIRIIYLLICTLCIFNASASAIFRKGIRQRDNKDHQHLGDNKDHQHLGVDMVAQDASVLNTQKKHNKEKM
jgi:hypothetical protein